MPVPKMREELTSQLRLSYSKLRAELDAAGSAIAELPCIDDWDVKDLLAVRAWWTEHVIDCVEAGRRGESRDHEKARSGRPLLAVSRQSAGLR